MTDEKITIERYIPEYGKGISECFMKVYGEGYPIKLVYNPELLESEYKKGNFYPVVAINDKKDVIGVMGMYRSSPPYQLLYECGAGIVLPQYREHNIAGNLCGYIYEKLAYDVGIEEIFGEAVCNHVKIQKVTLQYENIETGIEIDLMPVETFVQERSSSRRVSVVLQFRCYKDRQQDVYIPQAYTEEFAFLYIDSNRKRRLIPSSTDLPLDKQTSGEYKIFESASVARLMLDNTGSDLESFLDTYEKTLAEKGIYVSQIFLRLDCPWVGGAVDVMRSRGYFLSGILPRWFDADGMLMQKIYGEPNWQGIHLYSWRANKILEMIKKDWENIYH